MMDIVERLRDGCSCNIDETPCMAESECREAYEAADEITRLRAENKRLRELVREAYYEGRAGWWARPWAAGSPRSRGMFGHWDTSNARAILQDTQDG